MSIFYKRPSQSHIYHGDILPQQYDKMIKPYCWVILSSDIFTDHEQIDRIEDILYTISNEYGIPLEELAIGDNYKGEQEDTLDSVTEKDKNKQCSWYNRTYGFS